MNKGSLFSPPPLQHLLWPVLLIRYILFCTNDLLELSYGLEWCFQTILQSLGFNGNLGVVWGKGKSYAGRDQHWAFLLQANQSSFKFIGFIYKVSIDILSLRFILKRILLFKIVWKMTLKCLYKTLLQMNYLKLLAIIKLLLHYPKLMIWRSYILFIVLSWLFNWIFYLLKHLIIKGYIKKVHFSLTYLRTWKDT